MNSIFIKPTKFIRNSIFIIHNSISSIHSFFSRLRNSIFIIHNSITNIHNSKFNIHNSKNKHTYSKLSIHNSKFNIRNSLINRDRRLFLIVFAVFIIILTAYLVSTFRPALAGWWPADGNQWLKRKQLTVTNNSTDSLAANTTIAITIDTKTMHEADKIQSDCDDLRVLYHGGSSAKELTRHLVYPNGTTCSTSNATKVYFALQATLANSASSTDYYMYYKNESASSPSSTDNAFDIGTKQATLICPFDGNTDCAAGESPSTETGAIRYAGSKGALQFDGRDEVQITNTNSSLNIATNEDFTVELWLYNKNNANSGFYEILRASSGITIWEPNSNSTSLRVQGADSGFSGDYTLNLNAWNHIAIVRYAGEIKHYVNGVNKNTNPASGAALNNSNMELGNAGDSSVIGTIDEVRISNTARYTGDFTPSTIPFIRDNYTKLLLHMDENGDDPRNTGKTIDDSGNGNHGTINGAKYVSGLVGVDASTSDSGNINRQTYAEHEGVFVEEGTTNLITNPSFDHATYDTNWDAVGANLTVSVNTSAPYYKFGSKSAKIIASGTGDNDFTIGIDPNSTATHTLSAYVYNGTSTVVGGTVDNTVAQLVWEGTAQSGATYTDMGGGWWRISYSAATIDSTNEYGLYVLDTKTVYLDGVQLEQKSYATTYADGTLGTGYSWSGTAHESTSSRTLGDLQYSPTNNIDGAAGAFSFWINFSYYPAKSAYLSVFHTGNWTGNNAIDLFVNTNNGNQIFVDYENNGSGDDGRVSTSGKDLSDWHHVAVTWASNDLRMYIDSSLINQDTTVTTNASLTSNIIIEEFFGKSFSDLRIYDSSLTTAEVTDIYYSGLVSHSEGIEMDRFQKNKGENPVAIWHFDESYGSTANDSSTYNNDLTITNATWNSNASMYRYIGFDGDGDYLSRVQDSDLDFGSGSFSISGRFRHPSSISAQETIISKYNGAGYKIYLNSSGYLCFGIDGDSTWSPADEVCSSVSYADSSWHHFEAVKNTTSSIILYVDGRQVAQDTSLTANGNLASASTFYVGIDSDGAANDYNGFLDEIIVYPYARSASQVRSDYSGKQTAVVLGVQTKDPLTEGLIGWWKMDEASADTCTGGGDACDSSGVNRHFNWHTDATSGLGKYGNGIYFDGTSDNCYRSKIQFTDDDSFSIATWFKTNGHTQDQILVSQQSGTSPGYKIYLSATNYYPTVYLRDTGSNTLTLQHTTSVNDSSWHHLLMTFDGDKVGRLYIDGNLVDTETNTLGDLTSTTNWLRLGSNPNNNAIDELSGYLDEMRFYNRVLSPTEVQQLYNWAPGPVGHWKMDEASWTVDCSTDSVFDSSENNNHGDACPNSTGPSGGVRGKYGKAGDFDGNNDYVTMTENDSLDFGSNIDFTISAWVNTTQTGGSYNIIEKRENSPVANPGYIVSLGSTGHIGASIQDGTNKVTATADGSTFNDGSWHHLTVVFNRDSNMTRYLDGTRTGSQDSISGVGNVDNSKAVDIARFYGGGSSTFFTGKIDDVRIYNYARTPGQIIEDMNAGHPAPGSPVGSAVAYYKFEEGYGDTANNSGNGGSALNGTITGATWANSGKFGKALSFDGTATQYVQAPAITSLTTGKPFTISSWVKPITTGNYRAIIGYNSTHRLLVQNSQSMLSQQDGNFYSGSSSVPNNVWTQVVYWFNGTEERWYINGKQSGNSHTTTVAEWNETYKIGQYDAVHYPYKGLIDEVQIYNSALTENQIKQLYNQGKSVVLGAIGTDSSGNPSWSSDRSYCPPGDNTANCGPIAEWRLDEGTGTSAYDTSENSNTGTLGDGTADYRPTWSRGKIGKALNFDGSDDYVDMDSSVANIEGLNTGTISGWFKAPSSLDGSGAHLIWGLTDKDTTNDMMRVGIGNVTATYADESFYFDLWRGGGGVLGMYVRNGHSYFMDDTWHYFSISTGGGNNTLYIDGTEQSVTFRFGSSSTNEFSNINNPDSMEIGDFHYNSNHISYFNGQIDRVRVYNYARTQEQIAWDYNRGKPVGHWKLDECSGTTAYDSSGNGNNGTITAGDTSGSNDSVGTCSSGAGDEMWDNGTDGKRNASLDFDGTNDEINLDTQIDLAEDTPWTVVYWFAHDSGAGDDMTIGDNDVGNNRFYHRDTGSDYKIRFHTNAGFAADFNFDSDLRGDGWHHIAVTCDGTDSNNLNFYLDGRYIETESYASTKFLIDNIGNPYTSSFYWQGKLDEVKIFNYALTSLQIKTLFNNASAVHFK